jgi:hypothetical protein
MSAGHNVNDAWVSARMLADIGVRRADVFGAAVGAASLGRSAASLEGARTDAEVYALPRRRAATTVSSDLSAAA